jgi:nickel/cobalt exporter
MTTSRQIALSCLMIAAISLVADGALHDVLAQNPFGGPRAAPDAQVGGIVGWLLMKQSEFYREMSSTIRAAKADGSAVWTLLAISFAYGIFHAAGPGCSMSPRAPCAAPSARSRSRVIR